MSARNGLIGNLMAKKRKNDTRIDPFATAIEASSLDALLDSAKDGDVITMPAPADSTRTIRLTCKLILNKDIKEKSSVYNKNRRVQSLLTDKSVADIVTSIQADGRNQHPALTWLNEGKEVVLAGSRRRKACMISGADYLVLSSPDFNDEDAKILAVSSDQYIAPSLWELGQAYAQTKQELQALGKKGSYREIAQIEGVSHTAIADAIKAHELLPEAVLSLYPTANFVGREVAKKLSAARLKNQSLFDQKVSDLSLDNALIDPQSDDKTALAITRYLIEDDSSKTPLRSILDFSNQYIVAQKSEKSGDVMIKIDNRVLTDKRLEQLAKLLANFN